MRKISEFFLNKTVLIVSGFAAVAFWVIGCVLSVINAGGMNIEMACIRGVLCLLTLGLFISYFKGEVNVQKMLFGALLFAFVFLGIKLIVVAITVEGVLSKSVPLSIIYFLIVSFAVVVFVSHLLQQTEHFGKSTSIFVNVFCGLVIIFAFMILLYRVYIKAITNDVFVCSLAFGFTYFMIICMETRINEYKKIRTQKMKNDEWNDEARKEAKKLFKI